MKAAVLEAKQVMVCKNVDTPQPGAGEVLVRVAYCGVCGSDVPRFVDGAVHAFPLVLGHEFSGVVAEVGAGADASLIGRRVAGVPLVPCMECADCAAGNFSLCKHYSFIGSRQPGAYAEYVVVPEGNVLPVSDDVSDLEAAFFEPAAVAQHAIDLSGAREGSTAAVAGCGTIGIFTAQILQSRGLDVTAFARRQARIDAASAAGVRKLFDTSREGWEAEALSSLERGGFDYVFDTSGNAEMMAKSFELAANRGCVCMVGTPKRPIAFSVSEWENLNRKELRVLGSWMSYSNPWPGREWTEVERLFSLGELKVVEPMIDSIYDLQHISEGMKKFTKSNFVSGKLLVDCR